MRSTVIVARASNFTGNMPRLLRRLLAQDAGNTLALVAAAAFPIVAMIGGGLDMSRGYLVQTRLQQACDAGVLAARKRLGSEVVTTGDIPSRTADVGERFFNVNFRDGTYGAENTDFQMELDDDYSISGAAEALLPTTLMAVFGFSEMPIKVTCSAQINFSNTDVMMVLDVTGSMANTNSGDAEPKIDVMKGTIRSFHQQLEAAALAGSRIRYGFVPYSTNVNVGHLLKDEWVVDYWHYQARKPVGQTGANGAAAVNNVNKGVLGGLTANAAGAGSGSLALTMTTYETDPVYISGTVSSRISETYAATDLGNNIYACYYVPGDSLSTDLVETNRITETVILPAPGEKTTVSYDRTRNGDFHKVSLDGQTCAVEQLRYTNYVDSYDEITEPAVPNPDKWIYNRYGRSTEGWRTDTMGCIEERQTYHITDYDNVDINRALDLNIDLVPTDTPGLLGLDIVDDLLSGEDEDEFEDVLANGDATKWRPMYRDEVFIRAIERDAGGSFSLQPVTTSKTFIQPSRYGFTACPAPALKLGPMTAEDLNSYLDLLIPRGNTYHDIGMIWGARLMSPTGLFADENADVTPASPTSRNLIFLTDGQTAPLDVSYGTYGVEPLDQRRWSPGSDLSLTETVEKRFEFACKEAKKRAITVWVIGFGVELNPIMRECAGEGRFFEADDAAELNSAFAKIARKMSELRIVN